MATALFTPTPELRQPLPPIAWRVIRWCGVLAAVALIAALLIHPVGGLRAFWSVFVPIAPLSFLVIPGLWRNVCPMASLNQLSRTTGITRALTLPDPVRSVAPLISATLFFAIVPLRKVWLDSNATALALFLVGVLTLALVGGFVFKGKSGWCSSFCPMLGVERFYNLAPLVLLPNSHCRPCVGCTRNCYDFNPTAAHLADLHDEDPRWVGYRTLFAGALPWFIYAFNTEDAVTSITATSVAEVYGRLLLYAAAGAGAFMVLQAVTRLSDYHLLLLHVGGALNLFYWYVAPKALAQLGVDNSDTAGHIVEIAVATVTLLWLVRAWPRERLYEESVGGATSKVAANVLKVAGAARGEQAQVSFVSGPTVMAKAGDTLLSIAEANGVKIEAGCRMGMCGADPVKVVTGKDNLAASTGPERTTLERIGAGSGCRMACMAKVQGPVTVSTDLSVPSEEEAEAAPPGPTFALDPAVGRVVVIGTGTAGVSAVNELRKLKPDCELTIVGSEPYDFYNRMNIGKLVSEATSIEKLYMLPPDWAESRRIALLRGTTATHIDRHARTVQTDSGEAFPYDRVIIATGGQSTVPRVEGFDSEGCFVLRTLDDGVTIQQHLRRRHCRAALVIGGGLLGLEGAYAMSHLGVRVFVLDRNPWPLNRQLDQSAGGLLWQLMKDLGIEVLPRTEAARIVAGPDGVVAGVELKDGTVKQVQAVLAAAGVTPDATLAADAGLVVNRGVVVDDRLASSDPDIFAIGDVAEHRGRCYGLWPAAVDHARIAATNALGGDLRYEGDVPSCKLKVAGVDLLSVGEMAPVGDDSYEIRLEEQGVRSYRKLVIVGGEVRGGMLIGHPELSDRVATAVAERFAVEAHLDALRAGDWSVLPE